ncbi:(2E,6E)-farnesyl diphosphate synthase [Enterobacteriaceae bacterium LUAb1]
MDLTSLLNGYRLRVDQALEQHLRVLPFQNSPLVNAMQYGTLLGGKRLRPFLVYATGEMLHAELTSLDSVAAAVECIHAYSLIHDDLPAMDNDSLRRGQPTCHIRFGEEMAILAGDALQTLAFSILSNSPMPGVSDNYRLQMIGELAVASGAAGMCGGQALDLTAEGQTVSLDNLEAIHRHKTGALIRSAVRLGAFAAGPHGLSVLPHLDRYAEAIGLAFQIQDDILDVTGDTTILGKQQGADAQLGKSTYPALLGLEGARAKTQELYLQSLDALEIVATQSFNTRSLRALASFIIERDQ